MKVSIITIVLNGVDYIDKTINSVINQSFTNIEYIIIDGGSKDGTIDIIKKYENKIAYWVSEPDKGIYDAMNKGIRLAKGDIVGILNSDDFYADENVIKNVVEVMSKNNVDSCYGDLVYVDRNDINKIVRYWKAGAFNKERFKKGWMPPHPTFFVKRKVYEKYGYFNLDFPLAADYELMLRFLLKYEITTEYIQKIIVKMRMGGTSKPGSYTFGAIKENYRAWKVNGLSYPFGVLLKPLRKVTQWINK